MIIVDVFVPVLGESYDIRTDGQNDPDILISELIQLLCKKVGEEEPEETDYSLDLDEPGVRLKKGVPLNSQGVRNGSRLILV